MRKPPYADYAFTPVHMEESSYLELRFYIT